MLSNLNNSKVVFLGTDLMNILFLIMIYVENYLYTNRKEISGQYSDKKALTHLPLFSPQTSEVCEKSSRWLWKEGVCLYWCVKARVGIHQPFLIESCLSCSPDFSILRSI